MATKRTHTTEADASPGLVKAFLLRDCVFGICGSVVELSDDHAKQAVEQGMADVNPAAIAAAEANKV